MLRLPCGVGGVPGVSGNESPAVSIVGCSPSTTSTEADADDEKVPSSEVETVAAAGPSPMPASGLERDGVDAPARARSAQQSDEPHGVGSASEGSPSRSALPGTYEKSGAR